MPEFLNVELKDYGKGVDAVSVLRPGNLVFNGVKWEVQDEDTLVKQLQREIRELIDEKELQEKKHEQNIEAVRAEVTRQAKRADKAENERTIAINTARVLAVIVEEMKTESEWVGG